MQRPPRLAKGWYQIKVDDISGEGIPVRLRMDIGRGFSAFHSIALWPQSGGASAIARFHRPLYEWDVELSTGLTRKAAQAPVHFRRLGLFERGTRTLVEALLSVFFLYDFRRSKRRPRYLRWRGSFSFPARGAPQSEYQDWIDCSEPRAAAGPPDLKSRPSLSVLVRRTASGPVAVDPNRDNEGIGLRSGDVLLESRYGEDGLCRLTSFPVSNGSAHRPAGQHEGRLLDVLLAMDCKLQAPWLVLVRDGAKLHAQALSDMAEAMEIFPDAALFYGANDVRAADGTRRLPTIRSGFSIERLRHEDFLGPVLAISRKWLDAMRRTQDAVGNDDDHGFLLHLAELAGANRFIALPRVLSHLDRARGLPAPPTADAVRVIQDHLDRTGIPAQASVDAGDGRLVMHYRFAEPGNAGAPLVSIIIPTKDKVELLSKVVSSIVERSTWTNFEIIIVDHDSKSRDARAYLREIVEVDRRISVLRYEGVFNFSDMCNRAAGEARGDVLAFLNNDIEVLSPGWIEAMAGPALRPDIGCVGALLVYPNGRVQHAGVVLGMGGIAGHVGRGLARHDPNLAHLLHCPRNVAAVSAACMMIAKSLFTQLGGFDAKHLPVAFNDVDLCLRSLERGRQTYWTSEAVLLHHESATRDVDDVASLGGRFGDEYRYMRSHWSDLLDADPFHSPILSLNESGLGLRF